MAKFIEKQKTQALRRKGHSIKSIADAVGVSKATVSVWCRDIILSPTQEKRLKQRQILAGHRGRIIGAEMNRKKRIDRIAYHKNSGKKEIGKISLREFLFLGLGLYWGEGAKSRSGPAALVNSDPAALLLAKTWFEKCLGVRRTDFRPYVFISESHRGRETAILTYWSNTLNISRDQFHKIIFLKGRPKKFYKNRNSYYGVVALRIRRGTDLKYRIQGLLDACGQLSG